MDVHQLIFTVASQHEMQSVLVVEEAALQPSFLYHFIGLCPNSFKNVIIFIFFVGKEEKEKRENRLSSFHAMLRLFLYLPKQIIWFINSFRANGAKNPTTRNNERGELVKTGCFYTGRYVGDV